MASLLTILVIVPVLLRLYARRVEAGGGAV